MAFDPQLIVRIKSFLSSSDLTDSATARELYGAYLDASNAAARRVVECGMLIRKQQKIEAVLAARRPPELLDMLDSLICPERKQLDELADLYNWPRLTALDTATIDELRAAVKAMDDLRPLLTEFRRIARTDQLEEKLHLLREIYRLDKQNPEWHEALSEVENQYLFRLIDEAKQTIENRDEERLLAIHDELKNTKWLVPVPTIVMRKIDKIAAGIRTRRLQEQAEELLERIGRALEPLDAVALEDALLCWDKHCRSTGYQPDPTEQQRIEAATERLDGEKRKREEDREFQRRIERTGALIDRRAAPEEVEKCYASAEAMNREMPQFIIKRMKRFRSDIAWARRIAAALKGLRIAVTAVTLLVIVAGATLLALRLISERRIAAELDKTIDSGDLAKAQSMIADIERNQPQLAKNGRIVRAKAEVTKRLEQEKNRVAALNTTLDELNAILSRPTFKPGVFQSKLSYARELARNEDERQRINECAERGRGLFQAQRKTSENLFKAQVRKLQALRDEAKRLIASGRESGDFEAAEAKLREMDNLATEARSGSALTEDLVGENEDILNSVTALRKKLDDAKARHEQMKRCLNDIAGAPSIAALDLALGNFQSLLKTYGDFPGEFYLLHETLKRDLTMFKTIADYQNKRIALQDIGNLQSGFFADTEKLLACRNARAEAKRKLIDDFRNLKREYDEPRREEDNRLYLIRFTDSVGKNFDLYVKRGGQIFENMCSLKRSDGFKVTIEPLSGLCAVTIESPDDRDGDKKSHKYKKTFRNLRLQTPRSLKRMDDIYDSAAPHQRMIRDFYGKLQDVGDEQILHIGLEFMKKLHADSMCSPYWKMKLSRLVLAALVPADQSPDRGLEKLAEEFRKLDTVGNRDAAMHDQDLLDRIESFIPVGCQPGKLDRVKAVNDLINQRNVAAVEQKFVYLGVCLNRKNVRNDLSIKADPPGGTGDIWCFDKRVYGTVVVGSYSGREMIPNDLFRDNATGRLLFTTAVPGNMDQFTRNWLRNPAAEELKSMAWPEFWPSNLREE